MARKPRIHFPGAFYHVILRGNDRKKIFFLNEDKEYFYYLIEEGINRYGYRIHGFCLMNNHVHLAIQVGDVSLSKVIQNLSFRYTRRINQLQKKTGHLFQGRFKAILVDADNYLLELIRYIHFNPVRAKIVNKAEEYLLSSHRAYLGLVNIPWLTTDYVLSNFDDRYTIALSQYIQFMQNNPDELLSKKFRVGNQRNFAVLGDDDFLRRLKDISTINATVINLKYLVKVICSYYSIDEHVLKKTSKSRNHTKIRAIIAWLAREFNVCTLNEVAKYFNRDATGLIRVIRRFEVYLINNNELITCKELIEKSVCQA